MPNLIDAFKKSPGPNNLKEALVLYLKGVSMGTADIIPGVSGGTIALIAGIYTQLIDAIKSIDGDAVKKLLRLDLAGFLAHVHLRFLVVLLAGISTAIISIARLMNYLLDEQPVLTWSAFLGLILASIWILGKKVHWSPKTLAAFGVGGLVGFVIVGLIPVSTPETWWFIILAGMIAICAMILPGISGAFLLLIMGKYEYVTGALKHPFEAQSLVIIACFCLGAFVGITSFSRVLSYLLHHYEKLTLALLTGLMAGSLRKVWPFKEVLEQVEIRGKLHVLRDQNIWPEIGTELGLAIGLAVLGFLLVMVLERWADPAA
ncbi:MAG: DUF368 domain-containing protein [Candidatus Lambdaproteobacteria bacterium RIFOXYD12_FULL_49_8]|uniref:DUF368 domain-containing protein n=1 Tax=Candidatus Lambdaproteobacteria bacterium RIFOXYD2_FULL_50_16 TaxID=1817772 RepID=A0A1F6GA30_9PROT|nr:MAG: DUF368 domain-containing protein [Candidatus Lambdaproteobacteria bacterium RIFOXYD2_FULL_50_16]OGG98358.1 MAG: DUF368 domain-containing protein [Candidatus Lambdaproteobacteria bacterium RIFOXYD12_FULL_49_8]